MQAKANLVSDIRELVINGDFSAWVDDNPSNWVVTGEADSDPEVSEVGTGEGHGGTGRGMCNIYTSTVSVIGISQIITLVVGHKYKFSINIDKVTNNKLYVYDRDTPDMFISVNYNALGLYTFTFIASRTTLDLGLIRSGTATDVTFNNVSIKPIRQMQSI